MTFRNMRIPVFEMLPEGELRYQLTELEQRMAESLEAEGYLEEMKESIREVQERKAREEREALEAARLAANANGDVFDILSKAPLKPDRLLMNQRDYEDILQWSKTEEQKLISSLALPKELVVIGTPHSSRSFFDHLEHERFRDTVIGAVIRAHIDYPISPDLQQHGVLGELALEEEQPDGQDGCHARDSEGYPSS